MVFQNEAQISGTNDTVNVRPQVHILGSICIAERTVFYLISVFVFNQLTSSEQIQVRPGSQSKIFAEAVFKKPNALPVTQPQDQQ